MKYTHVTHPNPKRRTWLKALPCLALSMASAGSRAEAFELRLLLGDEGEEDAQELVKGLAAHFSGLLVHTQVSGFSSGKGPMVNVAVGPVALKAILGSGVSGPVVSVLTSSVGYTAALAQVPARASGTTAIFAEASPLQQLQWVVALFGRRVLVGVLVTPLCEFLVPQLEQAGLEVGVELRLVRVAAGDDVGRAWQRLGGASVVLALPDPAVLNVQNLRGVLEAAYRRNQAVVGFSEGMVQAGALGAAYASVADTVAHLREVVLATAAGRMPAPQFGRYWRVRVNPRVARSMNLVATEAVLKMGRRP
jgi:hypothetical protein